MTIVDQSSARESETFLQRRETWDMENVLKVPFLWLSQSRFARENISERQSSFKVSMKVEGSCMALMKRELTYRNRIGKCIPRHRRMKGMWSVLFRGLLGVGNETVMFGPVGR